MDFKGLLEYNFEIEFCDLFEVFATLCLQEGGNYQ